MNNKFIFILFLGVSLAACKKANRFDCIKRTGEIKTESRALEYFDIIDVQNNVNVFLIQDSINFAEIKAGKNLISNIETSVVAHTLYIKNNNKYNFTRSYKHDIEIYIHFKKLTRYSFPLKGRIIRKPWFP